MGVLRLLLVLALVFWAGRQSVDLWFDKLPKKLGLVFAIGLGLMWLYPAGLVNLIVVEGQKNIYRNHFGSEALILVLLNFLLSGLRRKVQKKQGKLLAIGKKPAMFWVVAAAMSSLLWVGLGIGEVTGDEREIGYRAYDLVDGLVAARKAWVISFNDHAPLGNYIHHFVMNALEPDGFESLTVQELRLSAGLMALVSLIAVWSAAEWWWGKREAIMAVLLAGLSGLFLFSGRIAIPQDLGFWNSFLVLSIISFSWWLKREKVQALRLAGITAGGVALVKLTGLVVVLIYTVWWLAQKRRVDQLVKFLAVVAAVISPVVVFNVGAFLTRGLVDVPVALGLRTLGLKVNAQMSANNIYAGSSFDLNKVKGLILTLSDMFYLPVFVVLVLLVIWGLVKKKLQAESLLILFVLLGLWMFYSLAGFRSYYLTFSSLLLGLVAARVLGSWRGARSRLVVLLVAMVSLSYALSSLFWLTKNITPDGEYGRSSEKIAPLAVSRFYSVSIRSWVRDIGLTQASKIVGQKTVDTVVVDTDVPIESLKWYLKVNNVRDILDESYTDPYKLILLGDLACEDSFLVVAKLSSDYEVCGEDLTEVESNIAPSKKELGVFSLSGRL